MFDQDECWFSRFALPNFHAWVEAGKPVRLLKHTPTYNEKQKALACYGAVRQDNQQTYLYFSDGQPNSEQTWLFMMGLLRMACLEDIKVVVIIWDNASWHKSKRLQQWLRAYNRDAKQAGEPHLLTYLLPCKSPWLNPIEPR